MQYKLTLFATGLATLASCGADAPMMMAPPPPEPMVELPVLCEELAKADCARLAACGALPPPFTEQVCILRQTHTQCSVIADQLIKTVALGHLSYDVAQAGKCRDEVSTAQCTEGITRDLFATSGCSQLVTGLSGAGAGCTLQVACIDGLFCDVSAQRCPGTCNAFAQNNSPCGGGELCDPSLFCSIQVRRCRARAGLGAPCELSMQGNSCVDSTFCDGSQPGGAVCAPARGRGTGCRSDFECAAGASCLRSRCSIGEEGDTCNSNFDCKGDLLCGGDDKCHVAAGDGEDCSTAGIPCAEGLACSATAMGAETCVLQPVEGGACEMTGPACYYSQCVNGTCAAAVADGGACTSVSECLPGRICDDGLCAGALACRL